MKIQFICFTYKRDAEQAKLLASTVTKDGYDIVFVDDALAPISAEEAQGLSFRAKGTLSYSDYVKSTFARRGNLNGADCVSGILDSVQMWANARAYDWIVKIDSDTVPLPALYEALAKTDKEVIGTLTGNAEFVNIMCGALYAIRPRSMRRMQKWWEGLRARFPDELRLAEYLDLQHSRKLLPEDRTMQQLVRSLELPIDSAPLGWFNHKTGEIWWNGLRAVSFGCYEGGDRPSDEAVTSAMKKFIENGRTA